MNKGGKKWDVIVTGELNIDIILNGVHSFPEMGKDIQADQLDLVMGSSSAIFACNIASLGAKVAFCGLIGNDYFGDFILQKLHERNIDTSMVFRTDRCHTGITFVLNYDNDRAMVTYHGTMALTSMEMIPFRNFKDASHFHMSSCFLLPELLDKLPEIYSSAKKAGMTTSLDPQWDPHEKWNLNLPSLMEFLDVFFFNEREFLIIAKSTDLRGSMEKTCSGNNSIVIKQGKQGSLLYNRQSGFNHTCAYLNSEIADPIGAGDSFNAGFIYKFTNGAGLAECQDYGSLTGAVSTTKIGGTAAFNDPSEVIKMINEFRNQY
jgi:sugar/nucleoside kinase (ribokinase family)